MSYNNYSQQNILLNTGTLSASVISPGVLQINFLTPGSISLQSDNLLLNLNFTALSSGKTDIVWNSFECVIYSASGDKVPAIYTLGDVDIKPAPQIETAGSGSYCEGTPLTLHASSPEEGIEFTWTRPDGTSKYGPNLNLEPLNPDASGEYTITGINKFSCSTTEVVPVTVTPNPKPVFTTIGDICTGPVIITTETTYSEYNWLVGSTSPELQVDTAGLYWLTVTDNNNCKASDSIRIFCDTVLRNDELSIWLPNAFSPDGDQINDVFSAKITPDVVPAAFNMKIFNKWGEEIYSSDDITKGWDGTFKGKPCASDLYTYIVTFTAPDNYYVVQKSPQRGVVMLYK
jgi:gliding motility-associated-like protein